MKAVALLRAVNLPGKPLTMDALRGLAVDLGLANARTLLQSGNLTFDAGRRGGAALETLLQTECARRIGLDTEFFVRTAAEWSAIIDANPFADEAERDPARLLLVVLKAAPAAAAVTALQRAIVGREIVKRGAKHVYVVYPDGAGRSRLTALVIEKALDSRGTARNWNTVRKIDALLRG